MVVTATLGEHGTSDPTTWPPRPAGVAAPRGAAQQPRRARRRRAPPARLEDGTCERHDGTDAVAGHIAAVEPDLIVTFGPDGLTGHPDHRAVCRWTTDAWATTRPSAELWYATVTPEFHRRWSPINDQIGLWADQPDPPCTEPCDLAHSTRLADELLDLKVAALRAHASQTRELIELLGPATYRQWWRTESFRSARSPVDEHVASSLVRRGAWA